MKKILIISTVLIAIVSFAVSGSIKAVSLTIVHYSKTSVKPKPRIKIYFGKGMPTCIGKFDICDVLIGIRDSYPGNYEANGTFDLGERNGSLIFETEVNSGVNQFTISECFSDGYFELTRDFVLSDEVINRIEFRGDPIIPKGRYRVEERSGMIRITFRE